MRQDGTLTQIKVVRPHAALQCGAWAAMPLGLCRDPQHVCLMFSDLVHESEEAVRSNQFLVVESGAWKASIASMVSDKVLRLWARMARGQAIAMLVPQHGAPIEGAAAIADFFDWVESLACGIDRFGPEAYRLPTAQLSAARQRAA